MVPCLSRWQAWIFYMFVTTSAMPQTSYMQSFKKNIQSFSKIGGTDRETQKQTRILKYHWLTEFHAYVCVPLGVTDNCLHTSYGQKNLFKKHKKEKLKFFCTK